MEVIRVPINREFGKPLIFPLLSFLSFGVKLSKTRELFSKLVRF